MYASNKINIVKLLIDAGADWSIKDEDNKDFFDYLNIENGKKIIELYSEKYKEYIMKKNAEKYNL